jgi:hypothetical protein
MSIAIPMQLAVNFLKLPANLASQADLHLEPGSVCYSWGFDILHPGADPGILRGGGQQNFFQKGGSNHYKKIFSKRGGLDPPGSAPGPRTAIQL